MTYRTDNYNDPEYIFGLLVSTRGNITQAAKKANMHRKTFRRLMNTHGIDLEDCKRRSRTHFENPIVHIAGFSIPPGGAAKE